MILFDTMPDVSQANPYGLAVYGILVAVLLWLLYRSEEAKTKLQQEMKARDTMLINITTESIKGLERATLALSPDLTKEREERLLAKINQAHEAQLQQVVTEMRTIISDLMNKFQDYDRKRAD